ncbi:MAG TPA: S41 family peptidase [Allosphingosinicella sp.]|nr:S41 family peptidase [Allosphingosinicella sp.]
MELDRIGLLLVPALVSAGFACSPSRAQPPVAAPAAPPAFDAAARKALIEAAIARLDSDYVFPERVPAIARALRQRLSAGRFDALGDPKAFADAVNAVVEPVAHDRHMRLFWSRQPLPALDAGGEPDAAAIAQRQIMMRRINYGFRKVEVLEGNIGYLKFNFFARPRNVGPTLAAAMAFLQHTDALIFDLRDNGGGDPDMVAMMLSYVVPPDTEIDRIHRRDTPVDRQMWALPYVPGGPWSIDKPIYVLTSNETASGAEEFAYDLQQMKRARIVGGVTAGAANPGGFFPLDRHFALFVPTGAAVNPISRTNWEGVGVKPDVAVDPAIALETARRLALDALIAGATGERADALKALLQPPSPNAAGPR